MVEVLLPGLMPEEWQSLIAACWAAKPEDRPTVCQLQHQICTLQQSLKASRASVGPRSQLPPSPSHTGLMTRPQAAPLGTAAAAGTAGAAAGAGGPVVLPKLLQGVDHWMPAASILHMPTASERIVPDGQSVHNMQRGNLAVAGSEAVRGETIAAVHAGRLPPKRGDSASDGSWSWKAGWKGKSESISAAFCKSIAEVSAKTAQVMQQLADTQLSAQSGSRHDAATV